MDTKFNNNYPLLSKIGSPDDLKQIDVHKLPEVCAELRRFLINNLSMHPGHFASSMGAIELTVALHYVFDTPYDRIVWDVGHQAYAHKLLTGRIDSFHTIRTLNGLSGFPNPEESEYDSFIAGHASNSISAALGMAAAAKMKNENRHVLAVIGDASISGGLAFEGLNNAAASKSNILIVLNDNDMSIDRNVGSLNKYLVNITTSKSYNTFRYKTYKAMKRLHLIDEKHRGIILRFNNSVKSLISKQQNIFEGLNIRYFGPYDGHDIERIVRVFRDIKDMEGPKILHLRTTKGKGYEPAEEDPCTWHAPGKFNPDTGEIIKSDSSGIMKYQDVFGKTLVELAEKNKKIVGITAAMPTGCSMTYMQKAFSKRTFDVGISEEHAVTFSGGLAKDGMMPFCCIYSSFLQRGYDEIIHDVAIQDLPVTFCIDRAGIVGEDGVTHHGAFDLSYLRSIPNMIVSSPMNEHYLRNLMYTAQQRCKHPFAIRYPRGNGVLIDWHNDFETLEIGRGRKLSSGTDIAILSIGPIGNTVSKAIDKAAEQGISVAHYDMIFLKPIDENLLEEVCQHHSQIITVEDGTIVGGLGSAVVEWINDHGYSTHVKRLGIPDKFISQGTVKQLHSICGIGYDEILQSILDLSNAKQ